MKRFGIHAIATLLMALPTLAGSPPNVILIDS